jgi:hypothetical protein
MQSRWADMWFSERGMKQLCGDLRGLAFEHPEHYVGGYKWATELKVWGQMERGVLPKCKESRGTTFHGFSILHWVAGPMRGLPGEIWVLHRHWEPLENFEQENSRLSLFKIRFLMVVSTANGWKWRESCRHLSGTWWPCSQEGRSRWQY